MASPQKENGYTTIANELLEAIYGRKFSASQIKILLIILRFTYGFNRKFARLSNSFISNGTGIHEVSVSRELKSLIADNVLIEQEKPSFNSPRMLGLNKNYESWQNHKELAILLTDSKKQLGVSNTALLGVSVDVNQERKKNKEKEEILPNGDDVLADDFVPLEQVIDFNVNKYNELF